MPIRSTTRADNNSPQFIDEKLGSFFISSSLDINLKRRERSSKEKYEPEKDSPAWEIYRDVPAELQEDLAKLVETVKKIKDDEKDKS